MLRGTGGRREPSGRAVREFNVNGQGIVLGAFQCGWAMMAKRKGYQREAMSTCASNNSESSEES